MVLPKIICLCFNFSTSPKSFLTYNCVHLFGQIYHRDESLLPLPGMNHKFLQIYFAENTEEQIDQRC